MWVSISAVWVIVWAQSSQGVLEVLCLCLPRPLVFSEVRRCLHQKWEMRPWLQNPEHSELSLSSLSISEPVTTDGQTLMNVSPGSAAPQRSVGVKWMKSAFSLGSLVIVNPLTKQERCESFKGIFATFCFTQALGFILQDSCGCGPRRSHPPAL